jgi:endonuclease YncB( thermonuclease family)
MRLAVLVILMLLPGPASAEITGKPRIIDGDRIEIVGQRIRLHGIDAPEATQRCVADNTRWPCGRNATLALSGIIGTNWITCRERGKDPAGGIVAICTIAGPQGPDVDAMMVASGWALADRRVATDYVTDEAGARRGRQGVWRGDFIRPWDWRRGIRLSVRDSQPGACLIKGDIARRNARIYHVPGGRHYARTRIDPRSGERWFYSETEARAAGWQRSRR